MDELNDAFAACFSLDHLMAATRKCASNTSWKNSVMSFMLDRLLHCARLKEEILTDTHQIKPTYSFTVHERGKVREVNSTAIDDRVLQRCFCDNVFVPAIKRVISDDNSACIKGRGLAYAMDRIRAMLERAPMNAWVLQFDFHDYFHSIDREILLDQLAVLIPDRRLWGFARDAITTNGDTGLELGSQVSQLSAVFYPNEMDWDLSARFLGYHRYMDDGLVICRSKADAKEALALLNRWVDELKLTLNEKKTVINKITHPIVFCKTRFKKHRQGVSMNVRKPQTRKSVRRYRKVTRLYREGVVENILSPYAATMGYINRGDADMTRLMDGLMVPKPAAIPEPTEVFDVLLPEPIEPPYKSDPAYKHFWLYN